MDTRDKWIPTICWACTEGPDLIRVHVVDGVPINVEANISGQNFGMLTKNKGRLCPKPYGFIQKLYNPFRIKAPLKRTNPRKGIGVDPKWVEISWDEALALVAEKLKEVRARDSNRVCRDRGNAAWISLGRSIWDAFFNVFGPTQRIGGGGTIRCDASEHTFGNIIHGGFQCEPDLTYCNYLIAIGSNYGASGGVPENVQFADAKDRGMKVIVVDPVLTITAAKADEWLPIKPGTDSAFLLALINVIVNELGIYDIEFLKNMTNSPYLVGPDGYFLREKATGKVLVWDAVEGKAKTYDDASVKDFALEGEYEVEGVKARPSFQVLKDHVRGYTAEWAAGVTDISADTIRRIAKEFVENAKIGSTIKVGNVVLPYRPVATKLGRGITGNMRSYQSTLANHILAALVGCLEVPGGHQGGRWQRRQSNLGITPGADGMPEPTFWKFTWPPVSYEWVETLVPYGKVHPTMWHLSFLNIIQPPQGFPGLPPPEVYIRYRTNALTSIGQPEIIAKTLEQIPFIVSISYVEDEMTQFADIVLPEHTEFERFELTDWMRSACGKKFWGINLRQPVVEPLYNTMDIADIFTELAERIGFLDEYNRAVNSELGLIAPYQLEPGKKYAWVDIVDRHCRSLTKGAHDLQWFKENGAIPRGATVEEQYDVHLGMTAHKLRYPIPYLEHVKKTGEELTKNLARLGIDWWPTGEYVALPQYVPPVLEGVPSEYDLYVTTCRSMQFTREANVDIPWLIEVAQHVRGQTEILINATTAEVRGIKDGDEVWVESEVGRVKCQVKLCQGVRPDTVVITHQFGNWAMPIAKDTGWVSLTDLIPIRHDWTDPVVGNMQGIVVKAKVYKA